MSVSIKQPLVPPANTNFDWKNSDMCRLILCRYKRTNIAHTVMRVGIEHYISFGHSYNDANSEVKIECVQNMGWLNTHVDFVRYYDGCDQLVLIGS